MKKKIYLLLAVFWTAMSTSAQKVKWDNPYTGYSNTQNLAISFIAIRSLLRCPMKPASKTIEVDFI